MKKQVYQWSLVFIIMGLCWTIINAWALKPAIFFTKATGTIEDVRDGKSKPYYISKWSNDPMILDMVVFQIDGKEYSFQRVTSNNTDYSFLIGKTVQYRHSTGSSNFLAEIICDNKIIFSADEDKPRFYRFVIYSVLLIIALLFLLAIQWKKAGRDNKKVKIKDEYFFDNWGIRKHNEKYTLTYISKLDGNVKYIKITEDEFLLAKEGKIGLDNFSSKYNLW